MCVSQMKNEKMDHYRKTLQISVVDKYLHKVMHFEACVLFKGQLNQPSYLYPFRRMAVFEFK